MNKRIVINIVERFSKVKIVTKVADGGPSSVEKNIATREGFQSRKAYFDEMENTAIEQVKEVFKELRNEIES